MTEAIRWAIENWATCLVIVGGLLSVASTITALTETPKDDAVVSRIKAIFDRISVLTHKDGAGTLKVPLTKSRPL